MSVGNEREKLENGSDAGLQEDNASIKQPQRLLKIGSGYEGFIWKSS